MEIDKDHIHFLIDYDPKISVLHIVRRFKQMSTYRIWKKCNLSREFWKERTFWSDGYFVCSVGDASEQTIRSYIENQG
jgi:putative transposase